MRYLEGNLPRITISVGVAAFPIAGDNPLAVLKAADEALYRAKDSGRNRVEISVDAPMYPTENLSDLPSYVPINSRAA